MNKSTLQILFPALLAAVLFFGCGRKPGEKLYHEALEEWDNGRRVRARALFEKSIRRRTGSLANADAYNRLGILLWEMGETDSAVDAFSESCRIDAEQYDVLCNLAIALNAQGSFDEAERIFREAALIEPNDPRPLAFAGAAYLRKGRWDKAERNLQHALKRTPESPQLHNAIALAELYTDGAETALKRLQATVRRHPDYAPALFNIASIYRYWIQNPIEATRWYKRYQEQSGDNALFADRAASEIAAIADEIERKKNARLTAGTPNRKEAEQLFKKALALHKAGRSGDAVKAYQAVIEQDGTYVQAFYNLGVLYYADNKMKLAGDAFARAVELNPAFVSARYNLALTAYNLGNNSQAVAELEKVLAQQPDYQPALDLITRIGGLGDQ